MNLRKFDKLTEDEQKIIEEVSAEAVAMQRELSIEKEDKMIAQLEANGMQVNRDVDGAAFQQAIQPVWSAYIEKNGDVMINKIKLAAK
jgi:TRAP-type C4-dicarboxylate transport system substrate-binding protein